MALYTQKDTPIEAEPLKIVALTYDDGPSKISTEKLLALLEKYGARATFFVNGNRADANKELVQKIVSKGSEIGNHTLDHIWLSKSNEAEIKRQIYGNENLLRFISGQEGEMLLRPPYGDVNQQILELIDIPFIMWSVDSRDWEVQSVSQISQNVTKDIKDGDIIIMHDGYETTIDATREVLEELKNRNFMIVGVSELFELKQQSIPLHSKVYRIEDEN